MEPDWEKKAREIVDKIKESPFWPDDVETIAQSLRQVEAETWEKAAEEALKERIMFLRHEDIMDGILEDNHPTIQARRKMREEIAQALLDRAKSLRTEGKPGKGGEGAGR